jgi:hypothetical protein
MYIIIIVIIVIIIKINIYIYIYIYPHVASSHGPNACRQASAASMGGELQFFEAREWSAPGLESVGDPNGCWIITGF